MLYFFYYYFSLFNLFGLNADLFWNLEISRSWKGLKNHLRSHSQTKLYLLINSLPKEYMEVKKTLSLSWTSLLFYVASFKTGFEWTICVHVQNIESLYWLNMILMLCTLVVCRLPYTHSLTKITTIQFCCVSLI